MVITSTRNSNPVAPINSLTTPRPARKKSRLIKKVSKTTLMIKPDKRTLWETSTLSLGENGFVESPRHTSSYPP